MVPFIWSKFHWIIKANTSFKNIHHSCPLMKTFSCKMWHENLFHLWIILSAVLWIVQQWIPYLVFLQVGWAEIQIHFGLYKLLLNNSLNGFVCMLHMLLTYTKMDPVPTNQVVEITFYNILWLFCFLHFSYSFAWCASLSTFSCISSVTMFHYLQFWRTTFDLSRWDSIIFILLLSVWPAK